MSRYSKYVEIQSDEVCSFSEAGSFSKQAVIFPTCSRLRRGKITVTIYPPNNRFPGRTALHLKVLKGGTAEQAACEQLHLHCGLSSPVDVWGPFLKKNTRVKWESKQSRFYG